MGFHWDLIGPYSRANTFQTKSVDLTPLENRTQLGYCFGVMKRIDYGRLLTEQNNPASRHIDELPIKQTLQIINKEDASVPKAVQKTLGAMERAVRLMSHSLKKGGRIIFIGAGTSGRLGVMEAAECPPTFNTPPTMVQAIMAGGRSSVFRSKEGAEDRAAEAAAQVRRKIRRGDVLVGIAASGVTPYVQAGLKAARAQGANTILVTCHPKINRKTADVVIAPGTGPEVIAGSTRLKAATATKLVLNALTVATMVQMGKVYGNRMVDLQPRSHKLRARATRLIQELGNVPAKKAHTLLKASGGNAKTAILMARKNIPAVTARQLLALTRGRLAEALHLKEVTL